MLISTALMLFVLFPLREKWVVPKGYWWLAAALILIRVASAAMMTDHGLYSQ